MQYTAAAAAAARPDVTTNARGRVRDRDGGGGDCRLITTNNGGHQRPARIIPDHDVRPTSAAVYVGYFQARQR